MLARLLHPGLFVALSSVAASLALGGALLLSRAGAFERAPAPTSPERASEEFMNAYRAHDYVRAASWSTGILAREMRKRAKQLDPAAKPARASEDGRSWVLQESHLLREDKLRFIGVLVRADEDESAGWPVALTVVRRDARFLVEDLHWPKGPPP